MYAIQTQHVVKQYKNGVKALDGINIKVKEGELFSLLGRNGAGKSTLIHILTTFLNANEGTITMLGKDLQQDAKWIRSQIACVSQQTSIDTYLSLEENMMFQSQLYRIEKQEALQRMEKLIKDFDLEEYRAYPVSTYSGGVKRRLDIALHMMSNPKILFLDEPTVGMDVSSRKCMWDMMKKIRNDFHTTIFLTTHYLEEADQLSDTICIMKEGKEVLQGSPEELRSILQQTYLKIRFQKEEEATVVMDLLTQMKVATQCHIKGTSLFVPSKQYAKDLERMLHFLLDQSISFLGIELAQPTLEDVYLNLLNEKKEGMMG